MGRRCQFSAEKLELCDKVFCYNNKLTHGCPACNVVVYQHALSLIELNRNSIAQVAQDIDAAMLLLITPKYQILGPVRLFGWRTK
jgi:MinD superfamily P-loop ATPase